MGGPGVGASPWEFWGETLGAPAAFPAAAGAAPHSAEPAWWDGDVPLLLLLRDMRGAIGLVASSWLRSLGPDRPLWSPSPPRPAAAVASAEPVAVPAVAEVSSAPPAVAERAGAGGRPRPVAMALPGLQEALAALPAQPRRRR